MKQYVVDAFSEKIFGGNPAAVCVSESPLSDELMMNITVENNLSETAFAVKTSEKYSLRWFTPGGEIDLCGHATLASAFVIMNFISTNVQKLVFSTLSGDLFVERHGDLYELDFPAYNLLPTPVTPQMIEAMGATPKEAFIGRDLLCVFEDEDIVRNMLPDLEKVKQLDGLILQVTAPGKASDCVSRSFAPKLSVDEDPVCGSGHCHIAPYWMEKNGKKSIVAYQASKRGGTLYCSMDAGRVQLSGHASLYSVGEIFVD